MAIKVPATFSSSLSGSVGTINADDDVIIQDVSVNFETGLTMSGVELNSFSVTPTCKASFGSASAGGVKLDLSASTYDGLLDYNGRGSVAYFDPETAIAKTKIRDTGGGTFYGLTGTWAQVEQSAGRSSFNETADVQIIHLTGGSSFVDIHASDTIDAATVYKNGVLNFRRTVTTLTAYGSVTMDERTPTCTTMNIHGDGYVNWMGGTITTLVMSGDSVLDLSMVSGNVTITNSTRIGNRCRIIKPAGAFSVAFTNATTLIGDATAF